MCEIDEDEKFFDWLKKVAEPGSSRRVYRGLSNWRYELIPKVGRGPKKGLGSYSFKNEKTLFSEFRRTAVPHLPQGEATTNWVLLSIAQHHGYCLSG